mgnify:CR=1 FL=1
MKTSSCKICKDKFSYHPSRQRGFYCTQICYRKDKTSRTLQGINAVIKQRQQGINLPKVSDEKLIQAWEIFKTTKRSMRSVFMALGYKRVPPKRLLNLLPKGEYEQYAMQNKRHQNGYLFKRGSHYERIAKKELEAQGYMVVKSGGSKGVFDLWALNKDELRLIQIKTTKSNANYTKLKKELSKIIVSDFCKKEMWIWIDRKGWVKTIF